MGEENGQGHGHGSTVNGHANGNGTGEEVDGEADAESQDALDLLPNLGDSGKYLDGSGEYMFPRHRLKSAWEGQSSVLDWLSQPSMRIRRG